MLKVDIGYVKTFDYFSYFIEICYPSMSLFLFYFSFRPTSLIIPSKHLFGEYLNNKQQCYYYDFNLTWIWILLCAVTLLYQKHVTVGGLLTPQWLLKIQYNMQTSIFYFRNLLKSGKPVIRCLHDNDLRRQTRLKGAVLTLHSFHISRCPSCIRESVLK